MLRSNSAQGACRLTVNVLSDPDIRNGIKEFSDWPTIPQLFVNGEVVKQLQGGKTKAQLIKAFDEYL